MTFKIAGDGHAAIEARLGVGLRRRLIAAAAGRSGRDDISERIEEIPRQESGR